MAKYTIYLDDISEMLRFTSISDFKDCINWGGEVEFKWNGNTYNITRCVDGRIGISMAFRQDTEKLCDTPDEVLEYMVGDDRLHDVITQVTVTDRTI